MADYLVLLDNGLTTADVVPTSAAVITRDDEVWSLKFVSDGSAISWEKAYFGTGSTACVQAAVALAEDPTDLSGTLTYLGINE